MTQSMDHPDSEASIELPPTPATLEEALAAAERALESNLKSAVALMSTVKKGLANARTGQLRDLRRALEAAETAAADLAEQTEEVRSSFVFDEQSYLTSGAYTKELMAAAEARGISIFEEDNQLLCYPSLLRVIPADLAMEIDKTKERRIRPSVLVDQLARNQERPIRLRAEALIDALREAYELQIIKENKRVDGVVKLAELWRILTLLPQGRKYSKAEFARDLYLLDQSGIVRTSRSSRELRWAASTGTKGTGSLVTVSRSGQRQLYWGISFTPPQAEEEAVEQSGDTE